LKTADLINNFNEFLNVEEQGIDLNIKKRNEIVGKKFSRAAKNVTMIENKRENFSQAMRHQKKSTSNFLKNKTANLSNAAKFINAKKKSKSSRKFRKNKNSTNLKSAQRGQNPEEKTYVRPKSQNMKKSRSYRIEKTISHAKKSGVLSKKLPSAGHSVKRKADQKSRELHKKFRKAINPILISEEDRIRLSKFKESKPIKVLLHKFDRKIGL
jgi:hypothetical protein